jgi:hypothetical protein
MCYFGICEIFDFPYLSTVLSLEDYIPSGNNSE